MQFLRQHRFTLLFLATLVFCSVMVIRQFRARDSKHAEIREAFILLHTRGYTNDAWKLYQRLLRDYQKLSTEQLQEDFQRTLVLIDPNSMPKTNLVWNYHWTISKELDRRQESSLTRARELADKEQ